MSTKKFYLVVSVLCIAPLLGVAAQVATTTVDIARCADLPSTITSDTTLHFTSSQIFCETNTLVEISGCAVELTSGYRGSNFNNVKFELTEASTFKCSIPHLDWTSVEFDRTPNSSGGNEGGAALTVNEGCSASFPKDVTFTACALHPSGGNGAAIVNSGNLTFGRTATFRDTPDKGALYTNGKLTFEGDALFENNKHTNNGEGNGNGAGLYVDDDGTVEFLGAASFIGNEVTETFQSGGRGAGMFSRSDQPLLFRGPVLFKANSGHEGALALFGSQEVGFESLVTLEDNVMEPKRFYDDSKGGGMWIGSHNNVEFRGGITATNNTARRGGVLYIEDDTTVTINGAVTITRNSAGYEGGAIYNEATLLTIPANARILDNSAIICPGINNKGTVEFTDGSTNTGGSRELCYLGTSSASTPVGVEESFDCESYSATAPSSDDYPYLILDTREVKTWNLGSSAADGFSCPRQLVIYVTGGKELTVVSTGKPATLENVRLEIVGYSSLTMDMPDLTITGIYQSQLGGAVFVGAGSSLDILDSVAFVDNTVAYESIGAWEERGGPAIYSDGDVKFHKEAFFQGNGQYEADADGESPSNQPGGAILTAGTMEFMKKATFRDNFDPNGGLGGAVANYGALTFNLRAIFQNNSVAVHVTDDGEPELGRGGALYNSGADSTVMFNRLAIFNDNVGALGGCAIATRGTDDDDDEVAEGDNRITFKGRADFKRNYCEGKHPTIYDDDDADSSDSSKGGGAILAYGASTVEFQNTAVFRRNKAPSGGAIRNAATISFVSDDKLVMDHNVATEECPDILNNDEATVQIGSETYAGPNADICDRSA